MQVHTDHRKTERASFEALRQAVISLNEGDLKTAAAYAELAAHFAEAKSDSSLYGRMVSVI